MTDYSVLIPLGHKEPPEYVRQCLESVAGQTAAPKEVVFVCDHVTPQPILDVVEQSFSHSSAAVRLIDCTDIHKRGGRLGAVLARGVEVCSCELIARMDADDVAPLDRCELQLAVFEKDPALALAGGIAAEFSDVPGRITAYRHPPEDYDAIVSFAKYRNPFNHASVMFRRSAVLDVGNYGYALAGCEDYDLWYRIIASGRKVANLPHVLLYSRTGRDLIRRRQNPRNTASYFKLKKQMLGDGFITRWQYFLSGAGILFLRYAPQALVAQLYARLLRAGAVPPPRDPA